jgi:hypothetical protein
MDTAELIRTILINPWYAVISIFVLTHLSNFFFHQIIKLNEIWWRRLEYFWITMRLFGVLTIIVQNQNDYLEGEVSFSNRWFQTYVVLKTYPTSDIVLVDKFNFFKYFTGDIPPNALCG